MSNAITYKKLNNRRSIRLKGYDYTQEGLYFITICCQDRAEIFGTIENGEMKLNEYGEIAYDEWKNSENVRDNIRIHEFVIMPNHIHGIIEILFKKGKSTVGEFKSPSQTIGSIIRGFKIATIKKIKGRGEDRGESKSAPARTGELQFAPTAPTHKIRQLDYKIWQRNYYEIIIRDEQAYFNISEYIINNPKKWQEDKFYKL